MPYVPHNPHIPTLKRPPTPNLCKAKNTRYTTTALPRLANAGAAREASRHLAHICVLSMPLLAAWLGSILLCKTIVDLAHKFFECFANKQCPLRPWRFSCYAWMISFPRDKNPRQRRRAAVGQKTAPKTCCWTSEDKDNGYQAPRSQSLSDHIFEGARDIIENCENTIFLSSF